MQEMQGFADSWLHSQISKFILKIFSATDGMPPTLSSQGAHNIEDVLLSLKLENKVDSTNASLLFGILEGTYKNLASSLTGPNRCCLIASTFYSAAFRGRSGTHAPAQDSGQGFHVIEE